jgi:hypothetical protein
MSDKITSSLLVRVHGAGKPNEYLRNNQVSIYSGKVTSVDKFGALQTAAPRKQLRLLQSVVGPDTFYVQRDGTRECFATIIAR